MSMTWDFILRLFVAGALGTVIGLDREYRAKEAGYRTHFLVSLGSALIMIVSQYGFMEVVKMEGIDLDPSRVAAQVVSGIGFIGAGTIIFQKQIVRGLTTAAGTRRGEAHKRIMNFSYETSFGIPKAQPEYLRAADYMILYNEALRNDGGNPMYSYQDIENARAGVDPVKYPDQDYYSSEFLRGFKPQNRVSAAL